jgi:hypothetical protein
LLQRALLAAITGDKKLYNKDKYDSNAEKRSAQVGRKYWILLPTCALEKGASCKIDKARK